MKSEPVHARLVRTKLHRPPVSPVHVRRSHLLDRLTERLHRPLTLVSAPAGYGKSTLVSSWLERCDFPSAWLSVEESDNDLRLFIAYVIAAIQTAVPNAGQNTEAYLRADELPPVGTLTRCFINELEEIEAPFILVIDDYHAVQEKAIHEFLEEILIHPPHPMHLVLASRIDPPLSLAKLRSKGQMTEVRTRDLRFSTEETGDFLRQMLEKSIDKQIIAAFEERTEGWVTGLHMAALSLRDRDDLEQVVTGLPDENRYVIEYLVTEILSQQSPDMQQYLLRTSILNRFCDSLCDALCVSEEIEDNCDINGRDFIQQLGKSNLFTIHLDDEQTWYRYHHLFQSLLNRKVKEQFSTEEINVLHVSASKWFAEHGHHEDAIRHALAGNDVTRAVQVVGNARHELMNEDQWHTLERWLSFFPTDVVQEHPDLILLRCWLDYYLWYRLDSLIKDLDQADILLMSSITTDSQGLAQKAEVDAIRSNLAYWILEPSKGIALLEQALRDSPDGNECTRSTAMFAWAPLYQMLGQAKQGERIVWDSIDENRLRYPTPRARIMLSLCICYWPEAETRKSHRVASKLLQISLEHDLIWIHSFVRYFLGLIHYERNELNEAVEHLEDIVNNPFRYPIQNVVHCSILLSLSFQALGMPDRAQKVAESISRFTFERNNQMFISLADALQAELDLRQGHTAQATQWANAFTVPIPHGLQRFFNAEFSYIKIMLARNDTRSLQIAHEQLDVMHELTERTHHRRLMIDVLAMKAILVHDQGEDGRGLEYLGEALDLAEAGMILRPFLDLGKPMNDLLKSLVTGEGENVFVRQILAAFSDEVDSMGQSLASGQRQHRKLNSNHALSEPLTNREIEILSILAMGLSNHAIADKLFISTETVKRHLYNIYQKLEVKNRQQATLKARSLGLV